VLQVARADAEHQPPAGELVEHGVLLGNHQRMVERQHAHRHAELDPARPRRGRRQQDRRRGHHAVLVEMMLRHEERRVAERVGQRDLVQELRVPVGDRGRSVRVMIGDREDAEPHEHRPYRRARRPGADRRTRANDAGKAAETRAAEPGVTRLRCDR